MRKLKSFILFTVAAISINTLANNESNASNTTKSQQLTEQSIDVNNIISRSIRLTPSQSNGINALNKLKLTPQSRLSREQVIAQRAADSVLQKNTKPQKLRLSEYVTFSFFDASSKLFEDIDYDGFYQSFSISFDADLQSSYINESALVFADFYLSRNGEPWELYFSSDPFTIIDDSSEDSFELLTTLDEGFRTGYYDVLIDLYEVGYNDIVATISSEELQDLYALPLESADYDQYIPETVYAETTIVSGGSISSAWAIILLLACMRRVFK